LSEIGAFIKVIVIQEAHEKADRLSQAWLGNNLKYKGLQGILKDIEKSVKPKPTPEQEREEIQKNWVRLAEIFKGRR